MGIKKYFKDRARRPEKPHSDNRNRYQDSCLALSATFNAVLRRF
jgi:hypothetical protein